MDISDVSDYDRILTFRIEYIRKAKELESILQDYTGSNKLMNFVFASDISAEVRISTLERFGKSIQYLNQDALPPQGFSANFCDVESIQEVFDIPPNSDSGIVVLVKHGVKEEVYHKICVAATMKGYLMGSGRLKSTIFDGLDDKSTVHTTIAPPIIIPEITIPPMVIQDHSSNMDSECSSSSLGWVGDDGNKVGRSGSAGFWGFSSHHRDPIQLPPHRYAGLERF